MHLVDCSSQERFDRRLGLGKEQSLLTCLMIDLSLGPELIPVTRARENYRTVKDKFLFPLVGTSLRYFAVLP